MADTITAGPAFTKPEVGGSESTWGNKTNANWDASAAEFSKTYAGNPNGFVQGDYVGQELWDSVNQMTWSCKTPGNSSSAVWRETGGYPTDTKQPFVGAAAPPDWAIDATAAYNNAALRIVTAGSVATGGSIDFTSLFGGSTGAYILTTADLPAHVHGLGNHVHSMAHTHAYQGSQINNVSGVSGANFNANANAVADNTGQPSAANTGAATGNTDSAGSGGGHSHPIGALKYLDACICKHN